MQEAIDQITCKILNLYNENTCIHEIDMLITMFINLYENGNIDCNKKVENKIYNLYQNYAYQFISPIIIKKYNMVVYYLIKHFRSSTLITA